MGMGYYTAPKRRSRSGTVWVGAGELPFPIAGSSWEVPPQESVGDPAGVAAEVVLDSVRDLGS